MTHRPYQTGLPLTVDPELPAPMFEQLYAQIRGRILRRELPGGAALPSSRRMASDLGVSRTTVLQALDALIAEGYLTASPRSAVRVSLEVAPPARRERLAPGPSVGAARVGGPPRAFRPGVPALDRFPIAEWTRAVTRAHRRASASTLEAAEGAGHPALRAAIAAHVASRGVRAAPEQVFVTSGTGAGVTEVLQQVITPGDAVWVEDPGYHGTRRAVLAAGGRPIPVRVDADGIDVGAAITRAPGARAALVTPSHHYPLGVTTSLGRRLQLLAWARATGAVVIEDDYDSEFRHRGRPVPPLAALDELGCVVYAGTFSKTVYPGLRIGFLVMPPRWVEPMARWRATVGNPASILEQDALAAWIDSGGFARHLRRMRLVYRERAEAFVAALAAECPELSLGPCDTGMQACAAIDGDDRAARDAAAAAGVEVGALSDYCAEASLLDGLGSAASSSGLVFGFGAVRPEALVEGCRALARALR
ncbi:MAG: PLP-dependent aminotransferase family protein [Myxococcota bacterium]